MGAIRRFYGHVLALPVVGLFCACSTPTNLPPPTPPQDASIFSSVPDGSLIDYLRAENAFTDRALWPSVGLEKDLTQEILQNGAEQIVSTPLVLGTFEYRSVMQQTLRHPLIYRKHVGKPDEVLVFDPNVLFSSYPLAGFGVLRISPQQTAIAFSVDLQHAGKYSLFIWNIGTQRVAEVSERDVQDVEWGSDDCSIFFTTRERDRAHALHQWNCTTPQDEKIVYEEPQKAHALSLRRAKNGAELILSSDSQVSSKVFLLPLGSADARLTEIRPFPGREKFSFFTHPSAYFIQKADGTLWKLERTAGALAHQITLPKNTRIEDLDVFRDAVVLYERRVAQAAIQLYRPASRTLIDVPLPMNADSISRLASPDFEATSARLALDSMISPRSVAEIDLSRAHLSITQPASYPAPYTAEDFTLEHVLVAADDGASIPVSIASLKKNKRPSAALLLGYGAYAKVSAENFSAARLSLLQRGFRIAVAHVRGDGILGQAWYDAGRRMHKKRSFEDFLTCARYLISHGYSSKDQLFAYGKSAGGLLVAVAAGTEPQLFRAIILDRPFVDLVAGLNDSTSDLAVRERDEWGNPQDQAELAYMQSYSPAHQIASYSYPPMLVLSGLRDETVPYWDVARWFALLRAKDNKNNTPTNAAKYLWVSNSATHESEVDDYTEARLQARMNAFLLQQSQH